MTRLLPIRMLRETIEGVYAAVSAAREYRDAGAERRGCSRPADRATADIPL